MLRQAALQFSISSIVLVVTLLMPASAYPYVTGNEGNETATYAEEMPRTCSSPNDCGPGECCVIGAARFVKPYCKPLGTISDTCIVGNEAADRTLAFPNQVITVYEVYRLYCPCEAGLECMSATCAPTQSQPTPPRDNGLDLDQDVDPEFLDGFHLFN